MSLNSSVQEIGRGATGSGGTFVLPTAEAAIFPRSCLREFRFFRGFEVILAVECLSLALALSISLPSEESLLNRAASEESCPLAPSAHTACGKFILSCRSGMQDSKRMKSAPMFSDGLALLHNSRAGPGHYSAPQNTSKTLFYLGEKVPRGSGDKR